MRSFKDPFSFWVSGCLGVFLSNAAFAKDLCSEYRNYSPLPDWYGDLCNQDGTSKANIGGAYSTFGDAFNLNPAAIPTVKIPVGIEYIRDISESGAENHFAFIKGFGYAGAAITTNSDTTFYGNSVFQTPGVSSKNTSANSLNNSFFPTLNIGSALNVGSFFSNSVKAISAMVPTLGATLKYNKSSKTFTPAAGLGWQIWKFSLGYSYSQDPANSVSPSVQYSTVTLGFKTSIIQAELVMMNSRSVSTYTFTSGGTPAALSGMRILRPASFLTLSGHLGSFVFTGAARTYQDVFSESHIQYHAAAEWQVSSKIAISYLSNYVIGHQSIGLQVLL